MGSSVRIIGADVSASGSNGWNHTWITRGTVDEEAVALEEPIPAAELSGSPRSRGAMYRALRRELLSYDGPVVAGLDFPFSLPEAIVVEDDWHEFLEAFPTHFSGAGDFQETCHDRSQLQTDGERKEIKRRCDDRFGGLCAYNRFIYRLTYFGVQDLLRPLVLSEQVTVWPFSNETRSAETTLVETYPAATLQQRLGVDSETYKDENDDPAFRREVTESILGRESVSYAGEPDELFDLIRSDSKADAFDSLVAAFSTFKWHADGGADTPGDVPRVEGWIHA